MSPPPKRLGLAFWDYLARYPTKRLPKAGGLNATVIVTMTLETSMGGLTAAQLDTGERISPGQARRLAADSGIIPAVLGTKSQVLDLGRKNRFSSPTQRILKTLQAGGCEAEGGDAPPGRCQLHHPTHWADGGNTNPRRPHHDLPLAPPPSARHPLRLDQTADRQRRIPPTDIGRGPDGSLVAEERGASLQPRMTPLPNPARLASAGPACLGLNATVSIVRVIRQGSPTRAG